MSAQRMTLEPCTSSGSSGLHRAGRSLRLAAGLIALALPLSGCGTGALWDKFTAKDDTFVDEPADKLYNEGLYLMNQRKDNKAASKKFEEVDRQHPYSDWARKSLLMSAYAFYNAGDYDSCIGAATRYVTLHPGSPDAAYAQYLIAASHYDQIPDISRDQGRTEKAIAALEEVIRKYPTSEYSTSAKAKLEGARDQLAGREMNVGRYYMEKRDYTAAARWYTQAAAHGVVEGRYNLAFLNLRGLGTKRTLTLLDSRRMVPSTAYGGPDVNLFPEQVLLRVEAVTGGASASYGTDAVSGVVNYILDTKMNGFRASAQTGFSERGDGRSHEAQERGDTAHARHLAGCHARRGCGAETASNSDQARAIATPKSRPTPVSAQSAV